MKDAKDKYTAICPKCGWEFNLGTDIAEVKQMSRRLSIIESEIAYFWSQIKDSKGEDTVEIHIGQDLIMDICLKEIEEFIKNKSQKQQEQ